MYIKKYPAPTPAPPKSKEQGTVLADGCHNCALFDTCEVLNALEYLQDIHPRGHDGTTVAITACSAYSNNGRPAPKKGGADATDGGDDLALSAFQLFNCRGCRYADYKALDGGRPCCTKSSPIATTQVDIPGGLRQAGGLVSVKKCLSRVDRGAVRRRQHA